MGFQNCDLPSETAVTTRKTGGGGEKNPARETALGGGKHPKGWTSERKAGC